LPVGVGTIAVVGALNRTDRISGRTRNEKWKNPPLRIEMSECINCDSCIRHCPPQFGAIFNHGIDVIIVPELCSGCLKCIDPCPVDCIYLDPDWTPAPEDWWHEPHGPEDPYRR
jgi:electron transport complex protein RnfB